MKLPTLVKCANCKHNFEARNYGSQLCPICHSELFIQPPPGYKPQDSEIVIKSEPLNNQQPAIANELYTEQPPEIEHKKEESKTGQGQTKKTVSSKKVVPTIKAILSNPSRFFAEINTQELRPALLFAWFLCTLAIFFYALYYLWSINSNPDVFLEKLQANPELFAAAQTAEDYLQNISDFLMLIIYSSPIIGILNPIISALLFHTVLVLIAKKRKSLRTTLVATCYGCAPMILAIIPFVGLPLGGLWTMALQVIALASLHRISPLQAIVAVLAPSGILFLVLMT